MKKLSWLVLTIYLILLFFTRFYNLPNTAQFAEDESGFLVRAHQIYKEKKITLVGQVNQFGTKVFSSLTIYLLLPFAILGKFDPISIFYGAAFLGVITVLVMLYLANIINKRLTFLTAVLLLLSYPLVRTGRWAWNPNFIPLWISLGLIFYLQKKKFSYFLAGIFFGLSVHQHYYAIFACFAFIFLISVKELVRKHFKEFILINFGFILMLIPFIVFDLRHPPGIFILGASKQAQVITIPAIFKNFFPYAFDTLKYHTQNPLLAVILAATIAYLLFLDLAKNKKALLYFTPVLFQIIFVSAVDAYFPHYFFAIIPFFFIWLIYPRQKIGKALSRIAVFCFIIGGVLSLVPQLTISPVEPNLKTFKKIDSLLEEQILKNDLKNVNIAVLASPDPSTQAQKYRNLLLIPNNLSVMTHDEYFSNDLLFVISTASETQLRKDPASELNNFRNGLIMDSWQIEPGSWQVYLFGKNI